MKYIFVTGGVVSGLGKGICAASLGRLLKQCGLRVKNQRQKRQSPETYMDSRCKHDLRSESLSGIQKRSFGSGWYLRICYLERFNCDLK